MRLQNKRTIITAAASGMGKAGVELFAREGAFVAAIDRDAEALEAVVAAVEANGGKAVGFVADLADNDAVVESFAQATRWLGGLDVLWSHAGIPAPTETENLDLDAYQRAAQLNVTQSTLLAGRALTVMREQQRGSIVFTASSAGLVGSAQSPLYSLFKAGIIGLTKGLAVRYAVDGIRVNAVCPGMVATPMLYNDFMTSDPRFTPEETEQRFVSAIPMGRPGRPDEIAHAALWLASDDSSFVTGVPLPVDGGLVAR
ncbi:SDR family NAD(P)-dependent oxidoreductase [Nocardia jinanensis]|uniref:3-oxoacyl-ACP reductase n=1 Tax=Nocardia jinanensis TaxID=382504 RepID=A0A917RL29_9NOCA|nr:SDR family NAD(P)-dependent oxidoreductase [Nocardia jinanensis]GGL12025.1 3-oxoacyl-ACP reductase [Nocardia jinanensis]